MWTTQSIAEGKDTGDSGEERKGHEGGGGGGEEGRRRIRGKSTNLSAQR